MGAERWREVARIFDELLDQPRERREELLKARCGDDQELRREVGSLLAARERAAPEFLEQPALAALDGAPAEGLFDAPVPRNVPAGTRFGPYRVVRRIGTGGMGDVYLGAA